MLYPLSRVVNPANRDSDKEDASVPFKFRARRIEKAET